MTKHKQSIALLGKYKGVKKPPRTEEHKKKLGLASKGRAPWNKGDFLAFPKIPSLCACGCNEIVWGGNNYKLGHYAYWTGKKRDIEKYLRNQRETHLGQPAWNKGIKGVSEETSKKMSEHNCMKRPEIVQKVANSKKGQSPWNKGLKMEKPSWNKGLHWPDSTIQKIIQNNGSRGKAPWNKGIEFKEIQGEKHHNWQGGLSFLPYCKKFNGSLKEKIRRRDNRTCQLCGERENGRRLAVHHIHYDKENCAPDLVSLCTGCHSKVHIDQVYWEEYFMNLLRKRGLLI